ncbi:hypothetical protein CDCA_CDCA15G3993 [Cyanidium caldarium]|uniref:Glycosyltransferase family 92 protein n=1 Tax=Cyanidium caldarium TaxID=2771 RepID=A0AAV9J0V2_CYACA|nr:hypothetical protein CDCA_CDCA15G3993 [Cyanidium caldarium]
MAVVLDTCSKPGLLPTRKWAGGAGVRCCRGWRWWWRLYRLRWLYLLFALLYALVPMRRTSQWLLARCTQRWQQMTTAPQSTFMPGVLSASGEFEIVGLRSGEPQRYTCRLRPAIASAAPGAPGDAAPAERPGEWLLATSSVVRYDVQDRHDRTFRTLRLQCGFTAPLQRGTDYEVQVLEHREQQLLHEAVYRAREEDGQPGVTLCVTQMYTRISEEYLYYYLDHYGSIGVTEVVLYAADGWDAPELTEVLRHWAAAKSIRVHVYDWRAVAQHDVWARGQVAAMNHCFLHHRGRQRTLLFADLDEFLFPVNLEDSSSSRRAQLPAVVERLSAKLGTRWSFHIGESTVSSSGTFRQVQMTLREAWATWRLHRVVQPCVQVAECPWFCRAKYLIHGEQAHFLGIHNCWGGASTAFDRGEHLVLVHLRGVHELDGYVQAREPGVDGRKGAAGCVDAPLTLKG